MYSFEQIEELQETLLETIKTKDPKLARRFVIKLKESDERSTKDILHSIENLAKEVSNLQKEMNIRFESMQRENNIRSEAMDKRFETMDKRFTQQNWLIGMMFSLLAILIAALQFVTA